MTCHLVLHYIPSPQSMIPTHTCSAQSRSQVSHMCMSIVDWESLVQEHHVIARLFRTKGQSFVRCLMFNAGLTFVDKQNNLLYPSVHVHRGIHVELSMNLTSYR